MPRTKKVQYKDYADYLKSPKWKQVKQDYRDNESTQGCLLCSHHFDNDTVPHYHHFKYPRNWNDDTWENLIILCNKCHEFAHSNISHNSGTITLRSYLIELISHFKLLCRDKTKYDCAHDIAYKLSKYNCEVVTNCEADPMRIIVLDKIELRAPSIARKLLSMQKIKYKDEF